MTVMTKPRIARTARALALMALASIGGCALIAPPPYAAGTLLGPTAFPPRPVGHPIRFFVTSRPQCRFTEIATVRSTARRFWQSREAVLEALRAKTRALGGDAIVDFREESVITGTRSDANGGAFVDRAYVPQGVAVRFVDPTCTE